VNGTDPREKFRIRTYNNNDSLIKLELKRKQHGKAIKTSCEITKDTYFDFLSDRPPAPNDDAPALLRKLFIANRTRFMRPKIIVEYDRIPYISESGNVRITFDMYIRSSNDVGMFFEQNMPKRLIMPEGTHILEVKFDGFLPDPIKQHTDRRAAPRAGREWSRACAAPSSASPRRRPLEVVAQPTIDRARYPATDLPNETEAHRPPRPG
jgi:hypothetical protein